MKIRTSPDELKQFLAALPADKRPDAPGGYRSYPVCAELLADVRTPVEILRRLKNVSSHTYLLESVSGDEKYGRYTFLGYDPETVITCKDGRLAIGGVKIETKHPKTYIRQLLSAHRSPRIKGLPPFTGGLVGYFSYDYYKYAEPTLDLPVDDVDHSRTSTSSSLTRSSPATRSSRRSSSL